MPTVYVFFSRAHWVNADGHVAGAPRDAFFKSGAGGHALYMIPSMGMVIFKLSSQSVDTFSPDLTGLPLQYTPDTSRDTWKPHPFNQFLDGPVDGDTGTRHLLELVVSAVVTENTLPGRYVSQANRISVE
jgi:hypothetical protein